MITRLFSAPIFEKEEDNFRAKFINGFAWIVILILSVSLVPTIGPNADVNARTTGIILSTLILVMFLSLYVLRRGNLNLSGMIIVVLGWIGLGIQAYTADGVRDVIIIAFIAISLLASIIINWRVGAIFMILSIAAIWVLGLLEVYGLLNPRFQEPIAYSRDLSLVFIAIAALIYFSTNSLREAITRANKSEENLRATNENLQELNQTLEQRVSQRTSELDAANRFNSQRARQFEAIAQVVRAISSIQDLASLLPRITQVVSEQFETYHTGIFLLDTQREYAELRASNSEGGQKMLARAHKLQVGQAGIVGFVTATGQPRIVLDVGADAVFFDNPDLPNTRSEIALPLRYAGQIIGALDVQSTKSNAFSEDDVEALVTLADQISIAINNTLILEEARKAFIESQSRSSEAALESWKVMQPTSLGSGFQLINSSLQPLEKPLEGNYIQEAIAQERSVLSKSESEVSNLAIPILLHGQVIGIMNLRSKNKPSLTQDDIDIAEAVSERLSLALENARLIQDSQRQVVKEQIISEVTGKIGASINLKNVLQTAVEELGRAMPGSDVIIQFKSNDK